MKNRNDFNNWERFLVCPTGGSTGLKCPTLLIVTSVATSVASKLKPNETEYTTRVLVYIHRYITDYKMSPRLIFKALVRERLVAAAEEIFQVFESTIVKYEEEICTSKQEIERLRGLLVKSTGNQKIGLFTFYQ